jgi:hypothetical protein
MCEKSQDHGVFVIKVASVFSNYFYVLLTVDLGMY